MRRALLLLAPLVLIALAAPTAQAKPKSTKERQKELNQTAAAALKDGDYDGAIAALEESIEIGELNITWLNLGRAYAKAGRCKDALRAYDRMAVAPRVDNPPAETLYEVLTQYREELVTECPGSVIVRCNPRSLGVVIDGGEELACPDGPIELAPGEHRFVGMQGTTEADVETVNVEGMATVYVELSAPAPTPPNGGAVTYVDSGAGALEIIGWSSLGVGVGMLVAAVLVDTIVLTDHLDAYEQAIADQNADRAEDLTPVIETAQTIDLTLYIAGGSLAAVGLGLVIAALVTADEPSDAGYVDVGLSRDGASLSWTTRF